MIRRQGAIQELERKYQDIPIELVKSHLKPSREVFEDIDVLAENIKRHGLLEPILVRRLEGEYSFEVVVGERRLWACRNAGLPRVPCWVIDGVNDEQILAMQLIENIHRSNFKVFEEVKLVQILRDHHGLSSNEIAVKTGLSTSTIQCYLTIAKNLPKEYIKLINHGSHRPKDLTITKAFILARANLPMDKLKEIVALMLNELSVRKQ